MINKRIYIRKNKNGLSKVKSANTGRPDSWSPNLDFCTETHRVAPFAPKNGACTEMHRNFGFLRLKIELF